LPELLGRWGYDRGDGVRGIFFHLIISKFFSPLSQHFSSFLKHFPSFSQHFPSMKRWSKWWVYKWDTRKGCIKGGMWVQLPSEKTKSFCELKKVSIGETWCK
jgi:hypothetical protein